MSNFLAKLLIQINSKNRVLSFRSARDIPVTQECPSSPSLDLGVQVARAPVRSVRWFGYIFKNFDQEREKKKAAHFFTANF